MGVGFSRDTHFDPELVKASEGLRLLIHEAFRTDEDSIVFTPTTTAIQPAKTRVGPPPKQASLNWS